MTVAQLQAHDRKLAMRELADRAGTRGSGDASYGKLKLVPPADDCARGCGLSLNDWKRSAPALTVSIDGEEHRLEPREHSTGSLGWGLTEKQWILIDVDGEETKVRCQVSLSITLIDSKPAGAK